MIERRVWYNPRLNEIMISLVGFETRKASLWIETHIFDWIYIGEFD